MPCLFRSIFNIIFYVYQFHYRKNPPILLHDKSTIISTQWKLFNWFHCSSLSFPLLHRCGRLVQFSTSQQQFIRYSKYWLFHIFLSLSSVWSFDYVACFCCYIALIGIWVIIHLALLTKLKPRTYMSLILVVVWRFFKRKLHLLNLRSIPCSLGIKYRNTAKPPN